MIERQSDGKAHAGLPRARARARMVHSFAMATLACLGLMMAGAEPAQAMTAAAASPAGASGKSQSCGEATGPTSCGANGPASRNDQAVDEGGGNPINVITGNKYQREVDLPALPGVLGLELVRHYNSQFSGIGFPNGIMGRGWKLSYETELHVVGRALQVVQADGVRLIFHRDLLDPSRCGTSRASDGRIVIRRGPRGDEHVWTWPDGRRLSFDHRGKLVQIAVPTGEFVTLQHDTRGHLVQVTDPQGRQLRLNYAERARGKDQPRRFTGVQSIDTPVGRYVYEYGSTPPKGTQVDKIQLVANLVRVHLPTHHDADKPAHGLTSRGTTTSAVNRSYHHEDARFPTLLTGISVSGSGGDGKPLNQRLSTYGYDQRAWAVHSEHGGLKVELAVLERASLSELPGSTPGRSVLVHGRTAARPQGHRLEIRSAMVAGDFRITETRGVACVAALPCPRANMRYVYDEKGRLTEEMALDAQGRPLLGVRTAYDPRDRVLRISQVAYQEGKPGPERWRVRYEYGASGEQPALVAWPSVVPGQERHMRMSYNERGQVLSVEEGGYSPLDAQGQPIAQPDQASPIRRITRYDYGRVNGRSVLVAVDGPLPGPADTTRYVWDGRADQLQAVHLPLGMVHRWTQRDEAGRITQEVPADGVAVAWQYLPTGEPTQWRRGGAQARADFDALMRPTRIELPGGEVQRITYFDALKGTPGMANGIPQAVALTSNRGQMRWLVPPVQPPHAGPDILDNQPLDARMPPTAAGPGSPMAAWPDSSGWVDDFGRLVALRTPETGLETRQYDEGNRLLRRALADGSTWDWQRDALGRITEHTVRRPGSVALRTRLHYEGVHLARIEHPHEQERLAYDGLGRLSQRTLVRPAGKGLAGLQATERYEHDEADRLLAWHLPEGGSLRYEWGVGRQLKAVRHRDGRAEAVLGQTVGGWLGDRLGVGQRTVIEPWPAGGRGTGADGATPRTAMAAKEASGQDAAQGAFALPALFQSEQGYRWGNGVTLRWHLNDQGQLARMRWELPPSQGKGWLGEWTTAWLPKALAQASPAAQAGASAVGPAMAQPANPAAPMLMQAGFGYDLLGRMRERSLEEQGSALQRLGFAYDGRGRLLLAQPAGDETAAAQPEASQPEMSQPEYYAYDVQGRLQAARWRGQDHDWRSVDVRRDATGLPQRIGGVPGQPERLLAYSADRRLTEVRQAHAGSPAGTLLASYTHNTHGLRIAKTVHGPGGEAKSAHHTQYLWQGLKLVAQTRPQAVSAKDAKASPATLARRYVYAHSVPVAVIDYADGAELRGHEGSIGAWFVAVWRWISSDSGELRYVHANEIGTPVAVTDAKARVIWRAKPTAYGVVSAVKVAHTAHTPEGFTLNLRLPGQYFDAETGWHDSVLRTYDPQRGEYLEPDPLGPIPNWRSGRLLTQPYAYANHNPLIHADPTGLILFAFDGTGNDLSDAGSWTNVARFDRLYQDGGRRYVSGVGTVHEDDKWGDINLPLGDAGHNGTGTRRIERMMTYLMEEARAANDNTPMNIDIVGFSRGAAQARDFANNVIQYNGRAATGDMFSLRTDAQGWFHYSAAIRDAAGQIVRFEGRQCVRFRFMGLWDTVLSTNSGRAYSMGIPTQFAHVAHAVALNEHRAHEAAWNDTRRNLGLAHFGGFPLVSIGTSSSARGQVRIERGFIGAHADIGGGYPAGENQLSFVALSWMVAQAKSAGVRMGAPDAGSSVPTNNPIVHDQSNALRVGRPTDAQGNARQFTVRSLLGSNTYTVEDRTVQGAASGRRQRDMGFTDFGPNDRSMTHADTMGFITYLPRDLEGQRNNPQAWETRGPRQSNDGTNQTGHVDIAGYMRWLHQNGYCFAGDACDRLVRQ